MSKVRLTVACPESDRVGANHLASCLGWLEGWQPEEWREAFSAQWQDGDGNLYRVMSCEVGLSFVATATIMGPIDRPAADVNGLIDLDAARAVQAKIVSWTGEGAFPQATPSSVVAVIGMDGVAALEAMGLTLVAVGLM